MNGAPNQFTKRCHRYVTLQQKPHSPGDAMHSNSTRLQKIIFFLVVTVGFYSCSPKINPEKPFLMQTNFRMDSLPNSEINIPIQINLKPIYTEAEKNVDTIFTSANWPDGWVQEACDMRYKYSFRRSPLTMKASGSSLNLGFTGFYKIIGSTRLCTGSTVLSPWTPPCKCGFDGDERKVEVNFTNTVSILPDYKIRLAINRQEPKPLDKCEVCFWGQDITGEVMKGLKAELDFAKKSLLDSFGTVDVKPQVQLIWNKLNEGYNLYGLGWLKINPQRLRINNFFAKNDSLNIFLGLSAKPVISFEKPGVQSSAVPDMNDFSMRQGFNIFLDAVLNYDSLSTILNSQFKGQRFDFSKGPLKKHIVIEEIKLYGTGNEKLIIKLNFSGSQSGVMYLTGKPVYDKEKKQIEIKDIDFDIKSKDALLKTANWLFSKKITNELQKNAKFDLTAYIETAKTTVNQQLNKEWIKGIRSYGNMNDIKIIGFYPLSSHLIIRSNCSGDLSVKADAVNFSF